MRHSVFATIADIAGSILIAVGIYYTIGIILYDGQILPALPFIFLVTGGISIKALASSVSDRVLNKKLYKVTTLSVAAYSLYKSEPSPELYDIVSELNPFAAKRIDEIESGTITEDRAIEMMRKYDSINKNTQ